MLPLWIAVATCSTAALSSCPQQRPAQAGANPTMAPFTSSGPLPDSPIRPGGDLCVPGSVDLVNQSNTMTLALTLDPGNFVDVVSASVSNGTYTFSIQNLMPDCEAPLGPPIGPITVTYGLNYAGSFFRGETICMDSSRVAFTAFSVTGIGLLDGVIEQAVKGNIWQRLDNEVADRMNALLKGGPLPDDAEARCTNWTTMPPNVAPGF